MHPSSPRRRAFTLIELLVVIAIIAILAAILFPVFAQAREKARQVSCLNNLKQIGTGVMMYVQDYDEHYFVREYAIGGDPTYNYQVWSAKRRISNSTWDRSQGLLQPYIKNTQIDECPSAKGLAPGSASSDNIGYGYNQSYILPSATASIGLAELTEPSNTVFLADTAIATAAGRAQYFAANWAPSIVYPTLHARHQGFANVLWADGHAKAVKPTYRTAASLSIAPEVWQSLNIGDLLHPSYPRTNPDVNKVNYYYVLQKP